MDKQQLTCQLARWHNTLNTRHLPWKEEKNAYKIWLSEIILQQTRAGMAVKYYSAFITKYPTITDLANAPDDEVFKLWEGLGYYTRCRNLLATAKFIAGELNGVFPNRYEDILSLQGVGPYTAAAIGSFAFNLPYAVVDGNVFRVLARCFNIRIPIDSSEGKKVFTTLANEVLDKQQPAKHNQSIMDFGATVCKPIGPLCQRCPLQNDCEAFQSGTVNELPVKTKLKAKKDRWFTYFVFTINDETLVHQRLQKDIWRQLNEFYLVETDSNKQWQENDVSEYLNNQLGIAGADILYISPQLSQQLTHQTVYATFIKIRLAKLPVTLKHYNLVNKQQLQQLAFPKIINAYLQSLSFPATLF